MSRKRQAGSVAGRAHTIFSWPRSVRAPSMTCGYPFGRGPCGCLAFQTVRVLISRAHSPIRVRLVHAATLMYALVKAVGLHIHWGNYEEANSFDHELMALAEETNAPFWKGAGIAYRGCSFLLTGNPSAAVDAIASGITAWRSTGATHWIHLAFLARAYARSDQFDNAWRCIHEAMTAAETTKERWGKPRSIVPPGKLS